VVAADIANPTRFTTKLHNGCPSGQPLLRLG